MGDSDVDFIACEHWQIREVRIMSKPPYQQATLAQFFAAAGPLSSKLLPSLSPRDKSFKSYK
jgi:hypothetical protein